MKRLIYLALIFIGMGLSSCYKDQIQDLQNRLDILEGTQIASLQGQIDGIKKSIPDLEKTSKELKDYVTNLQNVATNLQKAIDDAESQIEAVKIALQTEMTAAQVELLRELNTVKADLEGELAKINKTIEALNAKDTELDSKIVNLKKYVDDELAETRDWVNATLATLNQYSSVATEIATIKSSIQTINTTIADLESRLNAKIQTDIATAVSAMSVDVQEMVNNLVTSYTSAISTAKDEIAAAYTAAIAAAISEVETSMQAWVNNLLKGYCTIAETEGKLAALQSIVSENDKALQAEIAAVNESLIAAKTETEAAYQKAIADAITQNNGIVDGKISVAIAEINVRIENEIKAINTKITAIETRLTKIEGDLATISEQITNINATIAELQNTDTKLDNYIKTLQTTAQNLQSTINATDAKIDEVEALLKAETNEVKNEILNQLISYRTTIESELTQINTILAALQTKDEELDDKISELQDYVDNELSQNQDWVNATIATLEQYGSLATEIETIKSQIALIHDRISNLDQTLTNKINDQLSNILSICSSMISNKVSEITDAYTEAIGTAMNEITTAYKNEVQNAFNALNSYLRQWVNETLQQYYTIYEVEGRLAALKQGYENADTSIMEEITELQAAINDYKQEMINICHNIVEQSISNYNGMIEGKIAESIARMTASLESDIATVSNKITAIETRLNNLETDISHIISQINSIKSSIEDMEYAHEQLSAYVSYLESVSEHLEVSIEDVDEKIDEVEKALAGELSSTKTALISQFATLRDNLEGQLAQINMTIEMLMAKEEQLSGRIVELEAYIDTELANNKDWANATFATLEQQNALATEVASIISYISYLNQSINSLSETLEEKFEADIAIVYSTLDSSIQNKINDLTGAYSSAISATKEQITAAYTAEIQNAFAALEYSLKNWVNEQLAEYYTIAQVESRLATMTNDFNNKLDSQKAYLENLIASLSSELKTQIQDNRAMIFDILEDVQKLENINFSEHINRITANATAIAKNAQSIIDNSSAIAMLGTSVQDNNSLIQANTSAINANAALSLENKDAIEQLRNYATATITRNANDIATNAENIAKNASLIAYNSVAIKNNSEAVANNTASILQLQQDLLTAKTEITQAYKAAIQAAISQNGSISSEIAGQISAINSRINSEVTTINDAITAMGSRVDALEDEVDSIHQQMTDILAEVANLRQSITDLMNRIQSVSYIPKYSDGIATVAGGVVELDFSISPRSAVTAIAENWFDIISVKSIYTATRAVTFIDMPVISFGADAANGVITVQVSAENLSDEFFEGTQSASVALSLTDGNNEITSNYISIVPSHPHNEIWYTSADGSVIVPYALDVFGAKIISNNYVGNKGVIRFDGPVTSIGASAFESCTTLSSIEIPETVTSIGANAFNKCNNIESLKIPRSVTSLASLGTASKLNHFYIEDLSAWSKIDMTTQIFSTGDILYLNGEPITELVIPSDITEVKKYAFAGISSITKVTIPDSVVIIGERAFCNCTGITEATIGKNVTTISGFVFGYCSNLQTVYCRPIAPPAMYYYSGYGSETAVFPRNTGMKIYVPDTSYSRYTQYTSTKSGETSPQNWSIYKSYLVSYDYGYETPEPEPITDGNTIYYTTNDGKIANLYTSDAFNVDVISNTYENGTGKIVCSGDITTVSTNAFREAYNLVSMTFPGTITRFGQYVFYSCNNLTAIYLKSTTPPAIYYQYINIGSFPFRSDLTIYVPRSAYEEYTSYTLRGEMEILQINWSQHKSQLQPYDF